MDTPLLCMHLSFATDRHFGFFNFYLIKVMSCRFIQVVVYQPASSSFEQQNTKLPNVISLPPYFKLSTYIRTGIRTHG